MALPFRTTVQLSVRIGVYLDVEADENLSIGRLQERAREIATQRIKELVAGAVDLRYSGIVDIDQVSFVPKPKEAS